MANIYNFVFKTPFLDINGDTLIQISEKKCYWIIIKETLGIGLDTESWTSRYLSHWRL